MIVHSLILLLFVSIVPINSLVCYECACDESSISDCNCTTLTTEYFDQDYCVIIEQRDIYDTYIELTRIPRNATWLFIEDTYFILAIESIRYNLTANDWYLFTYGIIFGCDWDLCNSPSLINILPNTFTLSIDNNWLNTNIYGNGSVNSCHVCTSEECTDGENPFNSSNCPLTNCNNATSCLAYDLWNDLDTGEQCYYADCAPAYLDGELSEYYGGKYKIDIEAIVHLGQDRSKFEIWEIDVYCAVYNCTRSTIFEEVVGQLSANIGDLSAFPLVRPTTTQPPPTTTTPIPNPLTCYQCECFDTTICPCEVTTVISDDDGYCVIIRESFGQSVYVYSDSYSYSNSDRFIYEFPFALVEESISYDESGGRWNTRTNLVMYGCNWNLCNKPALVPLLPNSFQMRLPETWLNSSVLGSGQPVRDCHQCPDEIYCGTTDYLDTSVCPIQSCNTTCLVIDTWDDPNSDYLCYTSYCLRPDTDDFQQERHRIEVEGVVFASEPNNVQIWEVDIYCRADNCSSPLIFREFHQQLTLQVGNLAALFNETHDPTIPQRLCYDCYCYNTRNCSCDRVTLMQANSTYCLISRYDFGQDIWIDLGHIDQISSRLYIRDFPYLLVEESISYSEQTGLWNTITNNVVYGCNWDYCNHPSLIPYLPASFQMRLPETWLNSSILGTGQPVRDCHECPDAPQCGTLDFLDSSRCPIKSCNTTCLVSDTFDDPADGHQCYQSFCAPPDSDFFEFDRHRVEIEGILYLHKQPRSVELWEVDIYCRADDCSRPEIFAELKDQLTLAIIGDLSIFDQINLTTTTQSTFTTLTSTPSTSNETTTGNASIFSSFNFFIILLLSILSFNLY